MKHKHMFLFSLMALSSLSCIFSNPGDKQQNIPAIATQPTVKERKLSIHVLPPSPRSPRESQQSNEFDTIDNESLNVAASQKTFTCEQIHNCLLALKTFYKETGAKEEGLKVETTLAAFQPK